jgi:replicative DNA helicase
MLFGIHKREMMVLGARTSQGKTAFALQLAYDAATQGKRVYFFSLEMSAEALVERLFCQVARIPNHELLYHPDQYAAQAEDFQKHLADLPLVIIHNIGWSIKELWKAIDDLPAADMVIVDYVQMIRNFENNKIEAISQYTIRFREMCEEKDFAGILISQINRGAMAEQTKEPQLWLLKGSGALEENADTCVLLHWDYIYTSNINKYNDYSILVAKQRNGMVGKLTVSFTPQLFRFDEKVEKPNATSV